MSKKVNLTYTGNIRAVVGEGKTIAFVTVHDEGKPTALYKIDGESNKLSRVELPCGGISLIRCDDQYWIGGDDGRLYTVGDKAKSPSSLKLELPAVVTDMAELANDRIALLAANHVLIINRKAKLLQTIELSDAGSAIAANPDGSWLAIGTRQGDVLVYHCEESEQSNASEFVLSESETLHEGRVTSILFEPDELRFYSAGSDHKLLLTHARGRLEPEDRGRSKGHEKSISAMVLAGENRLITGSLDKTCKSWKRGGGTQPSTLSDGLVAVKELASIVVHKRVNLVVACEDNSLRLFLVDKEGKLGNALTRYNDGYVRAAELFGSRESSDRGQAMQELSALDDRKATEMLAERLTADSDNQLRLTAAKLLIKSSHSQLAEILKPHLSHPDSPVRMLVLASLEKLQGDGFMELYQSAIATGNADVGAYAIESLVKLVKKKDCSVAERNQGLAVLASSLNSEGGEIRNAAIYGLEALYDKQSPRPNLLTLNSKNEDSKRKGLIRLMQRGLLGEPASLAGLRRAVEDKSPEVRQTAFLVSVLSRPKLSAVLRGKDKNMDRKLRELESFSFPSSPTRKSKKKAVNKKRAGE